MTKIEIAKLFVQKVMPMWTLRQEEDNTYTLIDSDCEEIAFFDENGELL